MQKLCESDLYEPVKDYLVGLGYDVKAEVNDCDITAVKGDELVIVELKKGFTIDLIYQAQRRMQIADTVYVAVPLPKKGYNTPRYRDMLNLCKRLEFGLILVGFTTNGKPQVDVAVHPSEAKQVRKNKKKRFAVLTEHNGRTGSLNVGGVTRKKIITVYKEQALVIANLLKEQGALRAIEIREISGITKTSSILSRNFYKWYEKDQDFGTSKTTYKITEVGIKALEEYMDLLEGVIVD